MIRAPIDIEGARNAISVSEQIGTLNYMGLRQKFTDHPASVGETYGEHFRVAFGFAGSLAVAAAAASIHAVIPACCEKTASRRITALHARMTSGARGAAVEPMRAA